MFGNEKKFFKNYFWASTITILVRDFTQNFKILFIKNIFWPNFNYNKDLKESIIYYKLFYHKSILIENSMNLNGIN